MLSTLVGLNPQDGEEFSASNTVCINDEFNFAPRKFYVRGVGCSRGLSSLNLREDVAASLMLSVVAAANPLTSDRCSSRNFGICIIIVVLKRYKNTRGARRALRSICVTLCHTHDPQTGCFATRDNNATKFRTHFLLYQNLVGESRSCLERRL